MKEGHEFLYEFGPYTLNGRERVLMRDGQPVALAPKAFDLLLVLIRNSGRLVEKNQLMSEVWPATYVEEANLTQNISILRKVLNEGSEGSNFIETVPRRGYRFVVAVRRVSHRASSVAGAEITGFDRNAPPERPHRFLAILPFINSSADAKMEYLSDGITESIINSMSQLPQLRVMSRNTVFRYKDRELGAQQAGRELGVDAVLVGRVHVLGRRLLISTELVDVANGWQLWGDIYDRGSKDILEVQDEIARQISATLRLKLTGDDEQRLTKRYTESAKAYQAYLKGRYQWSKFTREGLEQAAIFFRRAIYLDPNYALAYAGIVDCYLRLATNYIPPAGITSTNTDSRLCEAETTSGQVEDTLEPVKTRYKWDWTTVERELKRARELKSSYPAAHQWHAAYLFSLSLSGQLLEENRRPEPTQTVQDDSCLTLGKELVEEIRSAYPTPTEEVQVFCTIAREQMEAGNYEGGCRALQQWWTVGQWPILEGLSVYSAGDLLFTAGALTGWVASASQVPAGQKHAEALLNGSIGIFVHLGARTRASEAQIELGYCYYRQGFFELARATIINAFMELTDSDHDLRTVALIRMAIVERHAGRLQDALAHLNEAAGLACLIGPWVTGRYHLELATTLKNLAIAETNNEYRVQALEYYKKALYEFEAVGNHRYAAVVHNNHGYLLLGLGDLQASEAHLQRARDLFDSLGDTVCGAQVDETIARLHLANGQFVLAEQAIMRSVEALEGGDGEALLAEALVTHGVVLCRLGRHAEAKRLLERGNQVAERCGDSQGAGHALLIMIEEMRDMLGNDERLDIAERLSNLLGDSQQANTLERLRKSLSLIKEGTP